MALWTESVSQLVESLAPEAEMTQGLVEASRKYVTAYRRMEAARRDMSGLNAALYYEAEKRMREAVADLHKEIDR